MRVFGVAGGLESIEDLTLDFFHNRDFGET